MRRKIAGEKTFAIFEVYYADDGEVVFWDDEPCAPFYNSEVDGLSWSLRQDYARMAEAFDRPVLDYETGLPILQDSRPQNVD